MSIPSVKVARAFAQANEEKFDAYCIGQTEIDGSTSDGIASLMVSFYCDEKNIEQTEASKKPRKSVRWEKRFPLPEWMTEALNPACAVEPTEDTDEAREIAGQETDAREQLLSYLLLTLSVKTNGGGENAASDAHFRLKAAGRIAGLSGSGPTVKCEAV